MGGAAYRWKRGFADVKTSKQTRCGARWNLLNKLEIKMPTAYYKIYLNFLVIVLPVKLTMKIKIIYGIQYDHYWWSGRAPLSTKINPPPFRWATRVVQRWHTPAEPELGFTSGNLSVGAPGTS